MLGSGDGLYDDARDGAKLNVVNPIVLEDVVNYATGPYAQPRNISRTFSSANAHKPCGWTVVRFKATNPGMWMMHCHIDWHLTLGMAVGEYDRFVV